MRRILANAHVSLDGVVQSPGGPDEDPRNGFAHGGWTAPYGDDRSGELLTASMAEPFDLLLGRRTYEIFAAYWPFHGDNPIGERFNAATKYVVTRSLDRLDWENSERIGGATGSDVAEAIARLKSGNGPDIHLWGSSELLHALTASGLIDEYRLWIYPLVLGRGNRLFDRDVPAQALTLVDTTTTSTGVMFNTYRPAGPVESGSFAPETPSDAELARRRKWASEDGGAQSSWTSLQKEKSMAEPAKNTICLWYDRDAEAAARFYAETFPDSSVSAVRRAPGDYPSGKEGDVLTVEFTVMGIPCLGLNGGSAFRQSEAFSFQVATVDQAETDRYWNAIVGNGGQESACGWCKDKWGVSWQITPIALTKAIADPDRGAAKRAFDAMMQMGKIDIATIEAAHRG